MGGSCQGGGGITASARDIFNITVYFPEFAKIKCEESTYMYITCDNNEKLAEKGWCLSTNSKQRGFIYVYTLEWKIDLKFDNCSSV